MCGRQLRARERNDQRISGWPSLGQLRDELRGAATSAGNLRGLCESIGVPVDGLQRDTAWRESRQWV